MADDPSAKPYLAYLDKEMTIMGILSTFAVAVPAFALSQLLGADDGTPISTMWECNKQVFIVASGVNFLAALKFYRQRSDLAYWYGQIALSITTAPTLSDGKSTAACLASANSWYTWRTYKVAFYLLYFGLFLLALGFLQSEARLLSWWVLVPGAAAVFASFLSWHWRQRYSGKDRPEPAKLTEWRRSARDRIGLPKD